VVTDYLRKAGCSMSSTHRLQPGRLRLHHLHRQLRPAEAGDLRGGVKAGDIVGCSVLSGNRNFEGRVHPEVRMNFLASPPLVVAYALAGSLNIDLTTSRSARAPTASRSTCATSGRRRRKSPTSCSKNITPRCSASSYAACSRATSAGRRIKVPAGELYAWDRQVDLREEPALLRRHDDAAAPRRRHRAGRARARRCSATRSPPTTSRRPATSPRSPAGEVPDGTGRAAATSTQYGARRGNHEVMMRGTFANIRLRNLLLPGTEGGVTVHLPTASR
jgi:aconitate hydratase